MNIAEVADTADTAFVVDYIVVVVVCFEAANTGCVGEAHNKTVPMVLAGNTFVLVLGLGLVLGLVPSADKILDISAFDTWVGPGVA